MGRAPGQATSSAAATGRVPRRPSAPTSSSTIRSTTSIPRAGTSPPGTCRTASPTTAARSAAGPKRMSTSGASAACRCSTNTSGSPCAVVRGHGEARRRFRPVFASWNSGWGGRASSFSPTGDPSRGTGVRPSTARRYMGDTMASTARASDLADQDAAEVVAERIGRTRLRLRGARRVLDMRLQVRAQRLKSRFVPACSVSCAPRSRVRIPVDGDHGRSQASSHERGDANAASAVCLRFMSELQVQRRAKIIHQRRERLQVLSSVARGLAMVASSMARTATKFCAAGRR